VNGQWIGHYTGTNSGLLVVDFDDRGTFYQGSATLTDERRDIAPLFVAIRTADKSPHQSLSLKVWPYVATQSPTYQQPADASFDARATLSLDRETLHVEAETSIQTRLFCDLHRARPELTSRLSAENEVHDWATFSACAMAQEPRRFIYRGQENRWPLRTRFHREGRSDLVRYQLEDVPALRSRLSSLVTERYDFNRAEDYGAFLSLVQHHGYPTPLLDWTYSPFVAAFFAYRPIGEQRLTGTAEAEKVRIFAFDAAAWAQHFPQLALLRPYGLHFSIVDLLATGNVRMAPQQATSTVTNVDDIEAYVAQKQAESGLTFLRAFDLPVSERSTVMQHLSLMSITAGALFPGLDGACEEVRERFFPVVQPQTMLDSPAVSHFVTDGSETIEIGRDDRGTGATEVHTG
jgi:hypothetical protein